MKYVALTDITNSGQIVSKDYGVLIRKGSVITETSENKANLKRLLDINSLEKYDGEDPAEDLNIDNNDEAAGNTETKTAGVSADGYVPEKPESDAAAEPHGDLSPDGEASILIGDEQLPDDLNDLKDMADDLGIQYASNIGADTLKKRIREKLAQ